MADEVAAWRKLATLDDDKIAWLIGRGAYERGFSSADCFDALRELDEHRAALGGKFERAPKRSRGLGRKTIAMREHIAAIFDSFDGAMSSRQVFYQLVSRGACPNTAAASDSAARLLVSMRRDGTIPYSRVVDRTRRMHKLAGWAGVRCAMQVGNAAFWTLVGEAIAQAVIAHLTTAAEVLPDGTPPLEADGEPVTGKGRIA